MIELNWDDFYYRVPEFSSEAVKLGTLTIPLDETLDFGAPLGTIRVRDLLFPHHHFGGSPRNLYQLPQLAMAVFLIRHRVYALNPYFPITQILDKSEQKAFYTLAGDILNQPNFKITLITLHEGQPSRVVRLLNAWNEAVEQGSGVFLNSISPYAAEIAFFVACHIAELFFYQRPILKRLMETSFEIRLATSKEAFEADGGVAGGCFNAEKRTIQLLLSRLFEGYKGKTPGVAPFLHEFGHLLDHFDVRQSRLTESHGTLPGMRERDGVVFNPQARKLFLKGKAQELRRYMRLHDDGYHEGDLMPIGHPYVFQNDGEFIAGYLEMFFRNPHYFAAENIDLFDSFRLIFGYDPRRVWAEDFPYYVQQNQQFYREHRPPKPGLTI